MQTNVNLIFQNPKLFGCPDKYVLWNSFIFWQNYANKC